MLLVLSPSKTLDYVSPLPKLTPTQPALLKDAQQLIGQLRGYTPAQLSKLMDISDKLAQLNVQRYQDFSVPFTAKNARPALLAFKGDVYEGMDTLNYGEKELAFAQAHLRILSGLYGVLRPLDLMQPYRLEMGTALKGTHGKDLYSFWGKRITAQLNEAMATHRTKLLVNLASEEYFKAVKPAALEGKLLTLSFKERKGNALKVVGLFAKRARGMMADYIIQERIDTPKPLQGFNREGYRYDEELSSDAQWVFVRG
jgi:uncharacterized protein